jgi:hypothetical protein
MAKLTKDEFSKIAEILSPLDKDPIRNETLNPMSRVLRKIKGLPELIPDEDITNDSSQESEAIEGGIELSDDALIDADTTNPPQMKYFDENDVDIDELYVVNWGGIRILNTSELRKLYTLADIYDIKDGMVYCYLLKPDEFILEISNV